MANASTIITVDFSDVKESSGINPKQQPEGDYLTRIIKAEVGKTKAGDPMVILLFQDANMRSAVYPYYCTLADNMLWKIRNAFIAAGLPVPAKKGKLDVGKLVNKEVGVTLEDDEYDGKMKSVISGVFHRDELEPVEAEEDDELPEDDDDDFEEEEAPAPSLKKKKAAPVVEEEDDEEEEEDEEEEVVEKPVSKRTAARRAEKAAAAAAAAAEEDEDEEEEEEEEAPAPKKKAKAKKAPVVEEEEDDDDDLDLDDI